jgi:transcriptional regulator with XRE-family HTH domain
MLHICQYAKGIILAMQFGDRFRALLRGRGLTQIEAGELLEMDQSTISRYCNMERSPRPHVLRHMADRLGVTVAELRGEKEPAGAKKHPSSKAPMAPIPIPNQSVCMALHDLKERWKKRPRERDTIRHLVAALFPGNHAKVLAWLEQA